MVAQRTVPAAIVAFVALLAVGCSKGGHDSGDTVQREGTSTKGPPPVTLANALGTCDDLERCKAECSGGKGDSCRRLAVTYEFGKSDAGRNETLGTTYYDRACALGDAPGCMSSGQMHEYGHGVPKDLALAADAYSRACTLGWQFGCANWALMLENGRGVPQDVEKAKSLCSNPGAKEACDKLRAMSSKDAGSGSAAP